MYDATYLFLQVIAIVYFAVTTCLGERVQVGVLFPLVRVTFLSVVCVTAASVHSPDIRQATKLGATVVRADCTQDFETRQACFSGTIVTAAENTTALSLYRHPCSQAESRFTATGSMSPLTTD